MERTLNDKVEIPGPIFACPVCKNTAFHQECYTKMTEIVNIKEKENKQLIIISRDVLENTEEDIEYNNEFQCPKCSTLFEVIKKDGEDVIVQIGLDGE
ncbi:MAG: hypothetical protein D4S01_08800 [Dehalococcoidia bacterium]|nr:MAG: hypothetical protein D4S01_08800 [Dehalococcoidia bacterium]